MLALRLVSNVNYLVSRQGIYYHDLCALAENYEYEESPLYRNSGHSLRRRRVCLLPFCRMPFRNVNDNFVAGGVDGLWSSNWRFARRLVQRREILICRFMNTTVKNAVESSNCSLPASAMPTSNIARIALRIGWNACFRPLLRAVTNRNRPVAAVETPNTAESSTVRAVARYNE